jgi:hypothetical protein
VCVHAHAHAYAYLPVPSTKQFHILMNFGTGGLSLNVITKFKCM